MAPPPASPTRRVAPAAHPEGVRISKLITERGLASRREADDWIAAGWVRVDGKMAVLYIDGDKFSRLLRACTKPAHLETMYR